MGTVKKWGKGKILINIKLYVWWTYNKKIIIRQESGMKIRNLAITSATDLLLDKIIGTLI